MVPSTARVVIIGGGVMGAGLAYHLAHEGWTDVILLEKAELTSGSTWHAAGQITHSTSSFSIGKCVGYNIDLYSKVLEKETGQSVTWHGCGSLRLAYTEDERDWLCHTQSVGRALGFPMEMVTPARIRELHPFYNLDGVLCALHTPDDGHVDPSGCDDGVGARCTRFGRQDHPPLSRDQHHPASRRRMEGVYGAGRHRLRARGQCWRHLCPADRRLGRTGHSDDVDDAPLPDHRHGAGIPGAGARTAGGAGRPHGVGLYPDGAKIRSDRHLREGQPTLGLGRRLPLGGRTRTVQPGLRPHHAVAGKRDGTHAGVRGTRHQARGARCHFPSAGRQPADRPGAGAEELLAQLRLPDRHRLGTGPDPGTGAPDGARLGRYQHARIRSAPFRPVCRPEIPGHQGQGRLSVAARDSVPAFQPAPGPPGQAVGACTRT